ncbi:MAG: condensation domain-containing protein [Pseudomonadota bacterium]
MTSTHNESGGAVAAAPQFRFPATPAQAHIWFLEQLSTGGAAMNVAVRWEIRGVVRDETIRRAFNLIISRHEILRTRFVEIDGQPTQEVMPSAELKLAHVDIRTTPIETQAERIDAIAVEDSAQPFDMESAPLIRATLVRMAADCAMLLITAHHSVFDGFSIGVLGDEFGTAVEALEAGRSPSLSELPLQFGDYALWQRDYLKSDALREDLNYWIGELKGAPYFEVEPDFPRPPAKTYAGAEANLDLPPAFAERLESTACDAGLTGFAYAAAILSAMLHRTTAAEDIVFGTHVAGRNEVDLETMIGVLVNSLILRIPSTSRKPIREHARAVGGIVKRALVHSDIPFETLVEALNPPRDRARTPIVSVTFDYQRTTFLQNRKYDGFELISRPSHSPGAVFDLNFAIIARPDLCRLSVQYDTSLFTDETANALLRRLATSFEVAFDNPGALIGDLPVPQASIASDAARPSADLRRTASPISREEAPSSAPRPPSSLDRLADIWGEVLGRIPDQCDGDFFALGGHSLLVVRMLAKVRQTFDVKLSLAEFIADPTLTACALLIDKALTKDTAAHEGGLTEPTWRLTSLKNGAPDGPVIVTVNHPLLYYGARERFGADAAIVNIHIPDTEAIERQADKSIDEIVCEARDVLLQSYHGRQLAVLGLCANGRVSYRLAQLLREAGETVVQLAMIDAWAPRTLDRSGPIARLTEKWTLRRRRWSYYARQMFDGEITLVNFLSRNNAFAKISRRIGVLASPQEEEVFVEAVIEHLMLKCRELERAPYDGEAILFCSGASTDAAKEERFGWDGVLRDDTPIFAIHGWHEDALLQAGLEKLARILRLRLGEPPEALRREGSSTS